MPLSDEDQGAKVRLAEVIASLSLATDLATGQRLEHGLRRALLSVWLGEELGLSPSELQDAYYVALLGTVGCTIEGAALARFFSDEAKLGEEITHRDPTHRLRFAAFILTRAGSGEALLSRARKLATLAALGPSESQIICRDVALQVGDFLKLGPSIRQAIGQCHEHWNGKGGPQGLKGEEISLPARLFILAHHAEIFHRLGGIDGAISVVRNRAGRLYDPNLAVRFCNRAAHLLTRLESANAWDAVLAIEPSPFWLVDHRELDALLETLANFVDVRSVFTLGHSVGVASHAESAALRLGLSDHVVASVRQASLLHDLGRLGIPVAVWNKTDTLTQDEWESMKRHPSITEVLLARSTVLGQAGTLAGLHHERLDGSGYRGLPAASLPLTARLLAAADLFQTKLERRPHRPQLSAADAAKELRSQASVGQLDADVVRAILDGQDPKAKMPAPVWPAGLSGREIEVLRLVVQGLSNRQMAECLFISPRTVGHHVQHIYDKIGVSTRVGATLFALQHDLLSDEREDSPK